MESKSDSVEGLSSWFEKEVTRDNSEKKEKSMKKFKFLLPVSGLCEVEVVANNSKEAQNKIRKGDCKQKLVDWVTALPQDRFTDKLIVSEEEYEVPTVEKKEEAPLNVYNVNINGKDVKLEMINNVISYQELVSLAFGKYDREIVYGVTYQYPKDIDKRPGSLTNNLTIALYDGMIFNVSR